MLHRRTLEALEFDKIKKYLSSYCLTNLGVELAMKLQPFSNIEEVEKAFTLYEQALVFFSRATGNERDGFALDSIPDVSVFLNLFSNDSVTLEKIYSSLDIEKFWALKNVLNVAREIYTAIDVLDAPEKWPAILQMVLDSPFPEQLFAALNRCISDDCFIKDESSPELYRIRNELRSLHRNCLGKVKEFVKQYNMQQYLQDEFMTLSSDRYVLPLKANFKGRMQGIIHDWSQTGETCYFEPIFLVEINNRLQELKHEERKEEKAILQYLATLLRDSLTQVNGAVELLGVLDFLKAKIDFSASLNCNRVDLTPSHEGVALLQARHPLLELARRHEFSAGNNLKNSSGPVQPIDLIIRSKDRALVITGGNAGGKTVCLKTFGLVAAMTLSGLPAPVAPGSHMPWLHRLDAFIGDEQSLDDNVSTFTAQIEHLAKAWKHLNENALVLLDEFGAGTDPAEGSALAQAVLDNLLEKNCFVLCATHFPALKNYALTKDGFRAATMLFDSHTNKPLFKIAYDQVGASHALAIAHEYGLPEEIIKRAEHYLLQDGCDSSSLLAKLNDLAAKREKELDILKLEQEKCRTQLKNQKERLDRERARLHEEIGQKSRELMQAYKQNRISAKQALRELNTIKTNLAVSEEAKNTSILPVKDKLSPGEEVFHIVFQKKGIITDIDERKNRVRLDMDGVSLWANTRDIRQGAPKTRVKKHLSPVLAAANGRSEEIIPLHLDVRGMRATEAVAKIEKYLDKALLDGFTEIEVIHGRGTGALRREIHEYLRSSALVEKIELAPEDRGGDGMTIIHLK